MSITDELRKYVKDHTNWGVVLTSYPPQRTMTYHEGAMDAIANRIDSECAEAQRRWMAELDAAREQSFNAGFDDGFASADDWLAQHEDAMREHGWVKLPKDADGKPIRIGDVMEWPDGETFEVIGIGDDLLFYVEGNDDVLADWTIASTKRHHGATVEDVLREFTDAILEWSAKSGTVAEVGTWSDVAAEYAAKLRLAGDAE